MKYYLIPSKNKSRNRVHITDRYEGSYFCGIHPAKGHDIYQGNREFEHFKMCKNCLRVQRARERG